MNEKGRTIDRILCITGSALLFAVFLLLLLTSGPVRADQEPSPDEPGPLATAPAYPVLAQTTIRQADPTLLPAAPMPTPTPLQPALRLYNPTGGRIVTEYAVLREAAPGWFLPHLGVDFETTDGQEVLVPLDGVVKAVRDEGVLGDTVVLKREEATVTLRGLSSVRVREGQQVLAGDPLGMAGAGICGGVHVELTVEGQTVDPALYLTQ